MPSKQKRLRPGNGRDHYYLSELLKILPLDAVAILDGVTNQTFPAPFRDSRRAPVWDAGLIDEWRNDFEGR